jgi:hypothetical protein
MIYMDSSVLPARLVDHSITSSANARALTM